jgi:hypothetical protein
MNDWIRLHRVRLRGVVVDAGEDWGQLLELGLVVDGRRGVVLSAAGRSAHAEWARLGPGSEIEGVVERAFARFLPLNETLLRLCHEWQVRPDGGVNDHRDRAYDWQVVDRLRALDEQIGPVIRRVERSVERFADYRPRLQTALAAVDEGRLEMFASPTCDSYHTVWMQLHEDLLLALGLSRQTT